MNSKSSKSGLRVLALALVVSALAAASAQAAEFHVGEAHSVLRGKATVKTSFTGPAGFAGITCSSSEVVRTTSATTETEWSMGFGFGLCVDELGRFIDQSNPCSLVFHATSGSGPYSGDADLSCGAGSWVTTQTSSGGTPCTTTIKTQSNLGPVDFVNEAGKVKIQSTINNIKATISGGFFTCGVVNGEYTMGLAATWLVEAKTTAETATTAKVE